MVKIPFNVSARTARLIGRENVSNADGAIIELVKNCYDADANSCIVFFDNKSEAKPNIYIIDNGEGMIEDVIKKHWMTIGTSNKLNDFYTQNKRVKTGAKGIGRFALDRLGKTCEMLTLPKGQKDGHEWKVNWTDFEQDGIHLGDVNADLTPATGLDLKEKIDALFAKVKTKDLPNLKKFNHGTLIKISGLNDNWDDQAVARIYKDLELLTPPDEEKTFSIFLFSTTKPDAYGKVSSAANEDYDYKLVANVDKNKNVRIVIHRNEFDVKAVDDDIFKRSEMKKFPYDRKTFRKKSFPIKTTLGKLMPSSVDSEQLDMIGPFSFTFYFMKRTYGKDDQAKFFYRHFEARNRSDWLKRFGGIKLFRDNFWIRPYGEAESPAFDWLGLGERAGASPAGITKQEGGWRVRPNQVAGIIKISRITNIRFEDKSSREGLQENKTFETFRNIILKLINKFEEDRHKVMRPMLLTYDEKHETEKIKDEALTIAADTPKKDKPLSSLSKKEKLARAVLVLNQEKEEQKEEFRLSRALASAGLIITSFSHELQHLSSLLKVRNDQLTEILRKVVPKKSLKNLKDYEDPFVMLKDMAEEDAKLQNWIQFSLNSVSKDKRTRTNIDLLKYFKAFQSIWSKTLEFRKVTLVLPDTNQGEYILHAFPIDIDSIFNNLLANSLDAFKRPGAPSNQRKISIKVSETRQNLQVTYEDSGPGLDEHIENPYKILEPFFTTKVDSTGKDVGTGLGMWIVKNIIDEYKGEVEIPSKRPGFIIKIFLPKHKPNA
jgi:signal transduction histidine kinase